MIVIGVTGSIGMGKSTISSMLKLIKIPVYDSDFEVKKLLEKDQVIKEKIKSHWPMVINEDKNQSINKKALSIIVFKNKDQKNILEKILHPIIEKKRNLFLKKNSDKKTFIALDIPLLYETGTDKICDYVFLAHTSDRQQRSRVLSRTGMTEEQYYAIKKNQWTNEEKKSKNPFIITTSYGKVVSFTLVIYYLFFILLKKRYN